MVTSSNAGRKKQLADLEKIEKSPKPRQTPMSFEEFQAAILARTKDARPTRQFAGELK
jgi:hypothetical protein